MLPTFAETFPPKDSQLLRDGDVAFLRMNMAREPDALQPGEYAFGRNVRTNRGKATTRPGMLFMSWSVQSPTPNTEPVWGSCSFRSPTGISYVLKARTSYAEACDPTGGTVTIAYPGGVALDDAVELVPMFNKVLMCRGAAYTTLQWVPPENWVNPFSTPFTAISQTGSGGTQPIPNAPWAILFKNRAIVPFNRDELGASDILNYTRYDPVAQQFKINQGDEQSVTGAVAAGRNSLLVGKDHSFFVLENFTGDLSQVTQDQLPVDIGLGARRTLVKWGTEILFMGPDVAFYSLTQALDNRLRGGDEQAFSDDIEPLMASIKGTLLHTCIARIWRKRLYLAVPMGDAAERPNVILVYDFRVGGWVSADTSELYEIQNLVIYPYQGRERLFLVHADGSVYLMEEGNTDVGADAVERPVATELITRGYTCGVEGIKTFQRGAVTLSTWAPSYSIQTGANGGNV